MSRIAKKPKIESNEDLINKLVNDDSILKVFEYLSLIELFRTRLVCKRWKQLIEFKLKRRNTISMTIRSDNEEDHKHNEYNERNECVNEKHLITSNDCIANSCRSIRDGSRTLYILTDKHLNYLFNYCPNIRALSLQFTIFDRNVWNFFRSRCPTNIEHLDFSNSQGLIDEVIRFIAINCGQTLKHVILEDSDISESSLKFLIENSPLLEILDVSNNVRISGQCFSLLSNHLKKLSLNQCWNINLDAFSSLSNGNGKHLNDLEINGEFLDNKMLEEICNNLINLKKFDADCARVTNKKILRKISNIHDLEELSLYLPSINFDEILIEIMRKCNKLKKLRIEGAVITDVSLKQLSIFCKDLESLSIISEETVINKKITDDSCESLSKLTRLTHLTIEYSYITDKLIHVIKSCPKLSTIEINGCKKVTNNLVDSCIEFAKNSPKRFLTMTALETKLTQPEIELPLNFGLILD
jgi:hypothetical protein